MSSPLRRTRIARKQTLTELALSVGTDPGNLSRIESGKQTASPALAEKIARHFGYELSEIQILYPERFKNQQLPAEIIWDGTR